jgi:hypothetical protein
VDILSIKRWLRQAPQAVCHQGPNVKLIECSWEGGLNNALM